MDINIISILSKEGRLLDMILTKHYWYFYIIIIWKGGYYNGSITI